MMFGHLIDHKMGNIFLQNHTQNATEILFPDPFLKKSKLSISWINILKFDTACFYGMLRWGLSDNIETKLETTCF